jgi:hypothetical protein
MFVGEPVPRLAQRAALGDDNGRYGDFERNTYVNIDEGA